jgi:hypothetical protein
MRKLLVLAGAALLAGCAYPSPAHVAALNALVGKSEADLLRAYGVPNRTYDTNGLRFVTYSVSRIESYGGYGFAPAFGFYPYGYGGFGEEFGPDIVQRDCNTTFELKGGVVQAWTLRGNAC